MRTSCLKFDTSFWTSIKYIFLSQTAHFKNKLLPSPLLQVISSLYLLSFFFGYTTYWAIFTLVSWLLTSRDDSCIFLPSPDLSSNFSSQIYYLKPDTSQRNNYTTNQTYILQTSPFPLTSSVTPFCACVFIAHVWCKWACVCTWRPEVSLIGSELTDWTWPLGRNLQGSFCLHFLVLGLQGANPACNLFLFAGVWTQVPELVWTAL